MKGIEHQIFAIIKDEQGQDLVEYAMVVAMIGLGMMVSVTGLLHKISTAFLSIGGSLSNSSS
jgi:pilus assembly protein Flp/PilA